MANNVELVAKENDDIFSHLNADIWYYHIFRHFSSSDFNLILSSLLSEHAFITNLSKKYLLNNNFKTSTDSELHDKIWNIIDKNEVEVFKLLIDYLVNDDRRFFGFDLVDIYERLILGLQEDFERFYEYDEIVCVFERINLLDLEE